MKLPKLQINRSPLAAPQLPPEVTLAPKRQDAPDFAPRSKLFYPLATLAVAAAVAINFLPSKVESVAASIAAALLIGLWLWWMSRDIPAANRAIDELSPSEPNVAPAVRLPPRHTLMPLIAMAPLAFAGWDGLFGPAARTSFFIMCGFVYAYNAYLGHKVLPDDSIEKHLQRDAAAIAFVVMLGFGWAIAFGGQGVDFDTDPAGAGYWIWFGVRWAPLLIGWAAYYTATGVLRRRRL